MPRAKKTTPRAKAKVEKDIVVSKVSEEVETKEIKEVSKKTETKKAEPKKSRVYREKVEVEVDIEKIKAELTEEIKKQIEFELSKNMHASETKEKYEAKVERSQVVLTGARNYTLSSDHEGFNIEDQQRSVIAVKTSGAVGFGTQTPKSHGPGSVHIKANYASEAALPTTGRHITRGLLVEGDSDDESSFGFRVVSRRNRQGTNVTGHGSLNVGIVEDETNSRLSVYQPYHSNPGINTYVPTRYFNSNLMQLGTAATSTDAYNFIVAKNQQAANKEEGQEVFKVTGFGDLYLDGATVTNKTGYAELFEWADGNNRNENRLGFTVTIDAQGKLRVADEGDKPVGVVVDPATIAVIGGAQWNYWKDKYARDESQRIEQQPYQVMEWENKNNTVTSYFNSTAPADLQLPENTVTYETDKEGNEMTTNRENPEMDWEQKYIPRLERPEWATVILTGTALMYRGQFVDSKWIKISDVSDDLEKWLIR
jgi:hypothetical protein